MPGQNFITLRKVRLFAPLTDEDVGELADVAEKQLYSPGESIILEGEVGTAMYAVCSGTVTVYKRTNGGDREKVVNMGAGTYFGLNALVEASPRSASVVAMESTTVLKICFDDLEETLDDSSDFAARFWRAAAKGLARNLRHVTNDKLTLRALINER